jgi:hypothetical protein
VKTAWTAPPARYGHAHLCHHLLAHCRLLSPAFAHSGIHLAALMQHKSSHPEGHAIHDSNVNQLAKRPVTRPMRAPVPMESLTRTGSLAIQATAHAAAADHPEQSQRLAQLRNQPGTKHSRGTASISAAFKAGRQSMPSGRPASAARAAVDSGNSSSPAEQVAVSAGHVNQLRQSRRRSSSDPHRGASHDIAGRWLPNQSIVHLIPEAIPSDRSTAIRRRSKGQSGLLLLVVVIAHVGGQIQRYQGKPCLPAFGSSNPTICWCRFEPAFNWKSCLKSLLSNFTLLFLSLSSQVSPSCVTVGVPTGLWPCR